MTRSAQIAAHPPAEVEEELRRLGRNIRTARLRRNIPQGELAQRLGVTRFLVSRMERGNPRTAVGVYMGALWAMGLLADVTNVADPDGDAEGRTLERARNPQRARRSHRRPLSADF